MNKPMKSTMVAGVATLVLIVAIAWMAGVFRNQVAPGLDAIEPMPAAATLPVTVRTETVIESVPASVTAKQTTLISSRILARINAIHVRAGDTVAQGQLLIELEKKDLTSRANQAQEQINSVKARLTEATANLKRAQSLIADGSIAAFELDKIRASHDSLSADLSAAELMLQEAQTAVSYTEIRAPIDGRVVDRFAEPGNTATPGTTLLSIYNPLSLRVEAQVREQLALSLRVGQQVSVDVPSLNKSFPAEIEELVPAANQGSRSFLVKTRAHYDSTLLPGMYARLLLPNGEKQQVAIPNNYVALLGQLNVVWVLKDGVVQKRFVKVGKVDQPANSIEIISGLEEGEMLVLPPPTI